MKRRVLSMVLAVCLILTALPSAAFAEENVSEPEQTAIEDTDVDVPEDTDVEQAEEEIPDAEEAAESSDDLIVDEAEETNAVGDLHVTYTGHVQTYGWQSPVSDGIMAGTSGESKRVEAITVNLEQEVSDGKGGVKLETLKDAVTYQAHVQTYGWMSWVSDGEEAGTHGESKRVEAFKIKLKGTYETKYDIYYCVHAQKYGWLGWAKNGESAGTEGLSLRLEAVKILLVPKGDAAPAAVGETTRAFIQKDLKGVVNYQTHVQTYGWQDSVADGMVAGTSGESKRMEAFKIWLDNPDGLEGSIEYTAHVQTYGWQSWVSEKEIAGTSGESKRVEAIKIRLTGELANKYHVYYRVHSQTYGTLGWAKDGEPAGSEGFSKRLENMEIRLVKKDDTATISSLEGGRAFISESNNPELKGSYYADEDGAWSTEVKGKDIYVGTQGLAKEIESIKLAVDNGGDASKYTGTLKYKVLTSSGWSAEVSSDNPAGVADSGKMIQAIAITLEGEAAQYCDVWYRGYSQKFGWLGWTRNGASAGTEDYDYRLEGVEIVIQAKNTDAPGSTDGAYKKFNPKFNNMTNRVQGLSSGTKYLIAVDCGENICGVYTGSKGNWNLLYAWQCTTGAAETPTCKGEYSIIYKKPYFGDTYTAWYASFFQSSGYAFHSVLYLPGSKTQFRDPRLGMSLSHGCVRLAIENAQWIYNNCGNGTKVYTYK